MPKSRPQSFSSLSTAALSLSATPLNTPTPYLTLGIQAWRVHTGLVDVLFGARSPAGRASVTYYTSTSELPPAGTMDLYPSSTSHGLTYRHYKGKPLFPFGFGLSYTEFKYSDLKVEAIAPKACDDIKVSVTVMNTGSRDGR